MSKPISQGWVTHWRWQVLVHCWTTSTVLSSCRLIPNLSTYSSSTPHTHRVHTLRWPRWVNAHVTQIICHFKGFSPVWWFLWNRLKAAMSIGNEPHGKRPRGGRRVQALLWNPHHWWEWLSILKCNSIPFGLIPKIENERGGWPVQADVLLTAIASLQQLVIRHARTHEYTSYKSPHSLVPTCVFSEY